MGKECRTWEKVPIEKVNDYFHKKGPAGPPRREGKFSYRRKIYNLSEPALSSEF